MASKVNDFQHPDIENKRGIFGFGVSNNTYLDFMNLVVLAVSGIIIKMFFQENHTRSGNSGPAGTTIWGYGLTSISLVLMILMAIYLSDKEQGKPLESHDTDDNLFYSFITLFDSNVLPIILTLGIIIYIICLNFKYFKKINSNKLASSYSVYSLFSSLLIIIQIGMIIKYMYNLIDKKKLSEEKKNKDTTILKGLALIITTINYIFVMILHILLAFFSTDG